MATKTKLSMKDLTSHAALVEGARFEVERADKDAANLAKRAANKLTAWKGLVSEQEEMEKAFTAGKEFEGDFARAAKKD